MQQPSTPRSVLTAPTGARHSTYEFLAAPLGVGRLSINARSFRFTSVSWIAASRRTRSKSIRSNAKSIGLKNSGPPSPGGVASLKKNEISTPRINASSKRRLALIRFAPFSYFWTCWNVTPTASANWVCDIPADSRRNRKRPPTCTSIGCGLLIRVRPPAKRSRRSLPRTKARRHQQEWTLALSLLRPSSEPIE